MKINWQKSAAIAGVAGFALFVLTNQDVKSAVGGFFGSKSSKGTVGGGATAWEAPFEASPTTESPVTKKESGYVPPTFVTQTDTGTYKTSVPISQTILDAMAASTKKSVTVGVISPTAPAYTYNPAIGYDAGQAFATAAAGGSVIPSWSVKTAPTPTTNLGFGGVNYVVPTKTSKKSAVVTPNAPKAGSLASGAGAISYKAPTDTIKIIQTSLGGFKVSSFTGR